MQIVTTGQPQGPDNKPQIHDPVLVTMDRPVYYVTERGPTVSTHPLFCGRAFAVSVLDVMRDQLEASGWSIAHVGIYNPRQARHKDGSLIKPARWSNHAYAEAMDFKGLVGANGKLVSIADMKQKFPEVLERLKEGCEKAIAALGRRAEIVDEGGWMHIGLWPASR